MGAGRGKKDNDVKPEQSTEDRKAVGVFDKLTEVSSTLMDAGELDVYSTSREVQDKAEFSVILLARIRYTRALASILGTLRQYVQEAHELKLEWHATVMSTLHCGSIAYICGMILPEAIERL